MENADGPIFIPLEESEDIDAEQPEQNELDGVPVDELIPPEIEAKPEPATKRTNKICLDKGLIRSGLCDYAASIDGLTFAPTKFICNKKSLTNIELLENFCFLRRIHIAFNDLTKLAGLENLHSLVELNASYNRLDEFPVGNWPSMTHLYLNHNRIKEMKSARMPRLKLLSLNNNRLKRLFDMDTGEPFLTGESYPELHTLELGHNKLYLLESAALDDTAAPISLKLQLPQLKALFLNHNSLTSLAAYKLCPKFTGVETLDELLPPGEEADVNLETEAEFVLLIDETGSALGELPELSVLNLRANGIRDLDGLSSMAIPKLQYLNLRENLIVTMEELEKLKPLTRLQTIILIENPICDMKNFRLEMRVSLQALRRLDKESYSPEENNEADALAEKRRIEQMTAEAY